MIENSTFLKDVNEGLSHHPKYLSSHYFYDKAGDELFQKIMEMPEYYLTNSELEIFKKQSEALIQSFDINPNEEFELIELGAGDGKKTKYLLKALLDRKFRFKYIPVDISQNTLSVITDKMENLFPDLQIDSRQGDYFQVLDELFISTKPKVILFIGSSLGNMQDEIAKGFLNKISKHLKQNEKLLLGVDLIKSEEIVLPAYHDSAGITRDFNFNLLHRINRELGADFKVEHFEHAPEYTETEGIAKSYLKSTKKQAVYIKELARSFEFDENELIHTEISRKYNDEILNNLLEGSQLEIKDKFLDSKEYFADYILEKK
ncbi:L-histidine N(alpha)-methyltransferase [Kaistella flava (ex Peng et al. 2021)]|uniref:L-histidine N(Alpha)-methyltransferase n=1 Tax=Kaistella flava (ex Peng et al. 2021) TaxID=2038776 RepID=A0A7M2YA11_9FLAO|nr:L-histidine N(alpha)-methyltransferase [Kaistella flava (ex Peng et al. 2021)]QOW11118.1 L-histidine N(alpha)-methyltransferase [Kaistella flava (ex Peng et al. 2021)]